MLGASTGGLSSYIPAKIWKLSTLCGKVAIESVSMIVRLCPSIEKMKFGSQDIDMTRSR